MTALAITTSGFRPTDSSRTAIPVDRAIRSSTAIVVIGVAGIAAYVSYWHAYAVVREYGETGVTAHLEPVTIDGLVYASSMVTLYAARHQLPVPRLARWLLVLGIIATLAANMAQGWSHGPGGMLVAAWPAISLVGSYELLIWIIRKAAAEHLDERVPVTDHPERASAGPRSSPVPLLGAGPSEAGAEGGHQANQAAEPGRGTAGSPAPTAHPDQDAMDRPDHVADVNAAAVAAYLASINSGRPLSERKLAGMFGKTSRRWARSRIAEARQSGPVPT